DSNKTLNELEFNRGEFWIQVHDLPLGMLSSEYATELAKSLGKLIELDCGGGTESWVSLKYECLSDFCYRCGCRGHGGDSCTNEVIAKSMFERENLSGSNYNDWFRSPNIVLRVEKKLFVIEQPISPAPPADSNYLRSRMRFMMLIMSWSGAVWPDPNFPCLQIGGGKPVGPYFIKMKNYVTQLECFGYVLPQDFSVGLILNGLTSNFAGFVKNHNTHNMGKTIGELHALLIEYEKGLPKKDVTPQDDTCHHCKEVGHCKRNCRAYLAELIKKKKQVGTAKVRKLKQVEAIRSFDLVLTNGLVVCLDNCHYAPTITRGVVLVSRLVDNGFIQCFTDYGVSVSKNNVLYLMLLRVMVFKYKVENQLENTLKALRSDRGDEYISQEFKDYLKACGIFQQLTRPYTPQHNGVSKMRNRTLLDMVRSMMDLTTLPLSFWDYALESAARILNMVPTNKVDKTPYELWYGKVSCEVVTLWIFNSYINTRGNDGLLFYFPPENKIVVARYTEFLEINIISQEVSGRAVELEEIQDEDTSPSENTSKIFVEVEGFEPPQEEVILVGRSVRTHQAPERLCLNVEVDEHSLGDLNEPTNYKVALLDLKSDKWLDAMNAEMQSIKDNQVWRLVDLPSNSKGFPQTYGVSYEETFSPVADIRAIRILIAIAAFYDYEIWEMNASGSNGTFLILYVDDIIIMGNHIPSLQSVKSYLGKCFTMKDLGKTAFIFGIKIYQDRMDNSKRGNIPMQEGLDLNKTQDASTPREVKHMQNVPYASAVEILKLNFELIVIAMLDLRPIEMKQNPDRIRLHFEWKAGCNNPTVHDLPLGMLSSEYATELAKSLGGTKSWVSLKYGRLSDFCYSCGRLGHGRDSCTNEVIAKYAGTWSSDMHAQTVRRLKNSNNHPNIPWFLQHLETTVTQLHHKPTQRSPSSTSPQPPPVTHSPHSFESVHSYEPVTSSSPLNDKVGVSFGLHHVEEFQQFTRDVGFIDIPYTGLKYTWPNQRNEGDNIRERIDRALECKNTVRSSWPTLVAGNQLLGIKRNLSKCASRLKRWSGVTLVENAQGEWVYDKGGIGRLVRDHFQSIYMTNGTRDFEDVISVLDHVVSETMNIHLQPSVTDSEIHKATKQLGGIKASEKLEKAFATKKQGGLGLCDFEAFNTTLLAKQGWRLLINPDSFYGRILKGDKLIWHFGPKSRYTAKSGYKQAISLMSTPVSIGETSANPSSKFWKEICYIQNQSNIYFLNAPGHVRFGLALPYASDLLNQAPTEGYGEAIVILEILAENFEIKTNLLQEALKIIENRTKVRYSESKSNVSRVNTNSRDVVSKTDDRIDKLVDQISNLVDIVNKQVIAPAKAVEKIWVTCGGAHAYYDCIATDSNQPSVCVETGSYNQVSCQTELVTKFHHPVLLRFKTIQIGLIRIKINVLRGDFNKQEENLRRNLNNDMRSIFGSFFQNQPSTSGTLPSNIVPNLKGMMKVVTTRSGLAYEGPSIPTNSPLEKVDEQTTEEILDKEHSNSSGSTAQVQSLVVPILILEPDVPRTQPKPTIPYPSRDGKLTPTRMTLELADRSITRPKEVAEDVFVKVGKFHFPTDFVVVDFEADPRVPLILRRSFLRTGRALIDVYGEKITLRVNDESITFNLNQTMRYSSTYEDNSMNRVDFIDIACEDFVQDVLDFQYNSKSSSPTLVSDASVSENDVSKEPIVRSSSPTLTPFGERDFFLEEIEDFLNDDSIPTGIENYVYDPEGVQSQRRVNPKVHDVIKKEVIKLLDAGMIYPISDSPWVSPIHCVPKKGGMTVVANENNELIPTRLVTGWRVCIDYRKLNDATRKDYFPLPFMDRMLERLAGNKFYCFLDGFSGYFQIPIDPQDQEKTTFTCPYGTFVHRRMPFGLCNAPGTFQRCMMSIFHDMIEKTMEVFMDDFLVFGDSFSSCLTNLDKMLNRCEETNVVLNWEKCHFMCREGIVLGHKILKSGIEVDRSKVDVIAKLPHPTTVKGVRSFLGHIGFYRHFI
nr:reverse transcriptase domain-containing protein [Tanacetum cinerariifolium]